MGRAVRRLCVHTESETRGRLRSEMNPLELSYADTREEGAHGDVPIEVRPPQSLSVRGGCHVPALRGRSCGSESGAVPACVAEGPSSSTVSRQTKGANTRPERGCGCVPLTGRVTGFALQREFLFPLGWSGNASIVGADVVGAGEEEVWALSRKVDQYYDVDPRREWERLDTNPLGSHNHVRAHQARRSGRKSVV